jgi:hypothetical protein
MAQAKLLNLRFLSTLGGLAAVGVAAGLNAQQAAVVEGTYFSPLCIAIVALAFVSALAVPAMTDAWRKGQRVIALVGVVFLASAELFGFTQSAGRIVAAQAQRAQQTLTAGSPYALAKEALDGAIQDRKSECATGEGTQCQRKRAVEDAKRSELARLPVPVSHHQLADLTGLPDWLVDLVPALAFSTGLLGLGFVMLSYGAHGGSRERKLEERKPDLAAAPVKQADTSERVVSWIRAYRDRYGRNPMIPEVQRVFNDLPKTTAWRRIKGA